MKQDKYSLGELVFDVGCLLKKYEQNLAENTIPSKLLKTKQVLEQYPILTQYGLDQAVRENKIPVIKRGKLNFFDSKDIENYIQNQKVTSNKCVSEKIKYV